MILKLISSILWGILFILIGLPLCGQDSRESGILDKEIMLHVDNDAMLIGNQFDKYYSSGIFASYRRLLKDHTFGYNLGKSKKLSKAIIDYELFHRMYTPENIKESRAEDIDRPYAGWLGVALGLNYYYSYEGALSIKLDAGWLGPSTRTEEVQTWWHDVLNMKEPRGWDYQINDTFAGHVNVEYQRKIVGGKDADITGITSLQLGSIRNNARIGARFRLGLLNSMTNSVSTGSKMGQERVSIKSIPMHNRIQEIYFFTRFTMEHVMYNATIEGNILGEPSDFTKEAVTNVFHHEYGFARSGVYFDMYMSLVFRSTEVVDAGRHQYMTIKLVHRI